MKAVIMAGGKGTRIAALEFGVPKPMIPVCGKPVLEHQIECLRTQGITDIIISVGFQRECIQSYFGSGDGCSPTTGQPFGVSISYFIEDVPLGTAGALVLYKEQLCEDFLLLNGDAVFDVNMERFYAYHRQKGGKATILTHPNSHPYDSGLIVCDSNGCVTKWLHREDARTWYSNCVNAGLHILTPELLHGFHQGKKIDLDRDVLRPLVDKKGCYGYASSEYVKDMGTPQRYEQVCKDVKNGLVKRRNLLNPQKAILLDRDGTINKYVGFLRNIDEFSLLEDVGTAIRMMNEAGWLVLVVTNQPVIARGEVTESQLREIHNKMETLLGEQGAYVDGIFYCPHHPDSGFAGEIPALKVDCDCRKPKAGLLYQAAKAFHLDLSQCWMVGDSESDMQAGQGAGCRTAKVGSDQYHNLLDFVKQEL